MSRRDDEKARASARNAKREAANVAAVEALTPEDRKRQAIRMARLAKLDEEHRRAKRLCVGLDDPPFDATVIFHQDAAAKQRALADALGPQCERVDRVTRAVVLLHGSAAMKARRQRKEFLDQARTSDRAAQAARDRQLDEHRRCVAQQEIADQARARGEILVETETEVAEWLRDDDGALITEDGLRVLGVERALARKRPMSDAANRLRTFSRLTDEQVSAGVRLETQYDLSRLSPRMVANLGGCGGGRASGLADPQLDAKSAVHHAFQALRLGGEDVVRVVEDIVIHGATSTAASVRCYPDAHRHNAHVAALLGVGLNLLANHYRLSAEKRREMRDEKNPLDGDVQSVAHIRPFPEIASASRSGLARIHLAAASG